MNEEQIKFLDDVVHELFCSYYIGQNDVSPDGTVWIPASYRIIRSIIERHLTEYESRKQNPIPK